MRKSLVLIPLLISGAIPAQAAEPTHEEVVQGAAAVRRFAFDYFFLDPEFTYGFSVSPRNWRVDDTGDGYIRYTASWVQIPDINFDDPSDSHPSVCNFTFVYELRGGWVTELSGKCIQPQGPAKR